MQSDKFDGSAKIWSHANVLAAHQQGELLPPVTVELDITNICSHRCPRCVGGRDNLAELPLRDATRVVDELASYGVKGLVFTGGGDPLCHPDCVSIITDAHEAGLDIGLITNGMAVAKHPEWAIPLAKACRWIRVSIDAGDADTYLQIHGVKRYSDAWSAVHLLGNAVRGSNATTTIGVGYLLGQATIDGMFSATTLARESGASYIQFRPFVEEATTKFDIAATLDACRALETEVFHVGYLDHKYIARRLVGRTYDRCHGCHFTAVIQADGHVPLCCLYRGQADYYGGNIFNESFRSIWEGERMEMLRTINPHECPPLCRHDMLNELVEQCMMPREHANFL